MACSCQGKGKNRFNVVVDGKTVFTTTNKHTAEAVGKRYPGSKIEAAS